MDTQELNRAIAACGAQWQRAVALLQEAEADVVSFNSCLTCCGRAHRWSEALGLLQEVKDRGLRATVVTYSACMSACHKAQRLGSAKLTVNLRKWREALQVMASADVKLDVVAYGGAIAACREQWQAAIALLNQMQSEQLEPNIIIYNSLLKACVKSQRWQARPGNRWGILRFRWP